MLAVEEPGSVVRNFTLSQQLRVLVGATVGIAAGLAVFLASIGIFLKPIAASFEWNRADISLLPVLFLVGTALGAQLIGHIAERIGWNRVIMASVIFLSLGMLAMSLAPRNQTYILGLALLIGVTGAATGPAGYLATVARVFDKRLGMAFGFVIFGSAMGVAISPIVAGKLLQVASWREAYLVIAGLTLLIGLGGHRLVFSVMSDGAGDATKPSTPANPATNAGTELSFAQAARTYRFWLIVAVACVTTGFYAGILVHLPSYATDQGLSPMAAAEAAASLGFAVAAARLGGGFLLDKVFAPVLAAVVFLIGATGYFLLAGDFSQAPWQLSLAVILIGVAGGAEGDILPFLIKKYFGLGAFGTLYGVVYGCAVLTSAGSAYLYGWCFEVFKSYVPTLQIGSAVFVVCAVAILTLGRYPQERG